MLEIKKLYITANLETSSIVLRLTILAQNYVPKVLSISRFDHLKNMKIYGLWYEMILSNFKHVSDRYKWFIFKLKLLFNNKICALVNAVRTRIQNIFNLMKKA